MKDSPARRYSASSRNLRSLLIIRSLVLLCQLCLLWYLSDKELVPGSARGMLLTVIALGLVTAAGFVRLRLAWPVTDQEYFSQLCIDVAALSAFLYFSGGANNPFVSYYLVPIVIAAAVLPRHLTVYIAGLSLAAYSALLVLHVPLPLFAPHAHGEPSLFSVHVAGMWVNFLLSVLLITGFVVGMAASLRQQEAEQVSQREDVLRNEQVLAVASLAAGTAHELGTPLSTLAVVLEEISDTGDVSEADIELLAEQVRRCKTILEQLSRTAELRDIGETRRVTAVDYLQELLAGWQLRRPQATTTLSVAGLGQPPWLAVELTLDQAIENLLNNAADACAEDIEVELGWDDTRITVDINDHGPGLSQAMAGRSGKPVIREGGRGLGLGLLISHATINRYGGTIELSNRENGGARARLCLPRETS